MSDRRTHYERNKDKYAEYNRRDYAANRELRIAQATARKCGQPLEAVLKRQALRRAGPDLLAALKKAEYVLRQEERFYSVWMCVRDAIAKATGGQP